MLPLAEFTDPLISKAGQGGDADHEVRDLRAELLAAEAAHRAKLHGGPDATPTEPSESAAPPSKRPLDAASEVDEDEEDPVAKRRRILEETRDIDADDSENEDDDDSSDDSSDEDETAELQRELEKIKRERAEKREREVRTTSSYVILSCV